MKALKSFVISIICCFLIFLTSCAGIEAYHEKHSYEEVRLIAVMPVGVQGANQTEAQMVRSCFINELYFRGYPIIPTSLIDEAVSAYGQGASRQAIAKGAASYDRVMPPQKLREALGVDAIVYIDIEHSERRVGEFSASYLLDITFRVLDARTGKELWKRQYESSGWMLGINKLRMEIKNTENYGRSLLDMMRSAVAVLPMGKGL